MEDTMGQLQWSMAMASMLGESCHNHGIDENYKDEVDEDNEGEVDEEMIQMMCAGHGHGIHVR